MFTLVGWSENQATGGVLTPVAALEDPHVRVEGDNVIVPELTALIGAFATGVSITRAQLRSPSMRRMFNHEVMPINRNPEEPKSPLTLAMWPASPIILVKDEALSADVAEDSGGADTEDVFAWLADGAVAPVAGEIFSLQVSSAVTLVPNAWTNGALTFDQQLPVGSYQIVGASFQSANLIAFRFVFAGFLWRPGGVARDTNAGGLVTFADPPGQRRGGWGVWGQFAHNTPPTVDFMSAGADTSEVGVLDLIKVA